ncbi:hypothetical protein [Paludibacterium paludis]|uniref:Uncharacterized protein n=1 Tax=Paludibacterium paludis TaxID=1225769 RepID=A0A918NYA1_9NEIS|nr:hypothetical protein [Paludibacterium paludis]GGY03950.1 hypothetical protein GCM10011289_02900 [Paludibacterium paludis]
MAKVLRALAHIFPAVACPIAHFPLEIEAIGFARSYLAQTGSRVTVVPAEAGFAVVRVGGL